MGPMINFAANRPGGKLQAAKDVFDVVRPVYTSDDCEIDLARRELRVLGSPVPVGGRAFEIIEILAESAGKLVTKSELMNRIWPGAIVMENTLQVHAAAVRKALGAYRSLLKTESGRGYRLLGSWTVRHQEATGQPRGLQRISASGEPPRTNIPASATRLVGRAAAAQRLRDLISAYRVVTLTGPGGIGKSALALKVARRVLGDFADGGWLVELASLSDPDLVPSAVASVLGLKISGEVISAEIVARAVGERHLLLVLDNCEHLIDAVAGLTEALVRQCPHTTILTTTREVLRIDGEYVCRVPPLDVPEADVEAPDHILGHSAVELFIARTQALESDFMPRAHDLRMIAAICRQLDGIPLAIEFAAARAATLGLWQVTAGLHDRFTLLTLGRRTAVARQRTLRATLDWSHELLPEVEQLLLRRLAIFPAGFTVDAAAAVMTDTGFDVAAVTDGITNLVMKSLIVVDAPQGVTRWHLLETVRAYAHEKLVARGEVQTAAGCHAMHFRDLFKSQASDTGSSLSDEDMARCVQELDNVRAALDWSFSTAGDKAVGVDLTVAYAPVWHHLSLTNECRERCERALTSLEPHGTVSAWSKMKLRIALGSALVITMGCSSQAKALLIEALETADALNDLKAQGAALSALLAIFFYRGEHDSAQMAAERIEQIAHRTGDTIRLRYAWQQLGTAHLMKGRPREAQEYFERVLRSARVSGDRRSANYSKSNADSAARAMLARALLMQGFAERALEEARASLEDVRPTDPPVVLCRALHQGICRIATMIGDFAMADREIVRLIELARGLNARFWETAGSFLYGKLLVERGEFAQGLTVLRDAFETYDRAGWRLSYPEFKAALALAFAGTGRLSEALDTLDDAMAAASKDANLWYVPELLRIKGEVLLTEATDQSAQAAEACFNQAGEMARAQQALFWELRVALSVARLRVRQRRRNEARQILAPVYDRFTEGFDTMNLREAKAMLDALQP
jgi:predicted ATPase/DNA-binding winged helix-turn-helix (wHTH) protein